jgi:hypothetical protein
MRLLPAEHQDLLMTLESIGLNKDQFGFRKKAGWFRIELFGRAGTFDFHRKKITTIVDGKFEHGIRYRVRFDKKIHPVVGWEDVLQHFKTWLSQR